MEDDPATYGDMGELYDRTALPIDDPDHLSRQQLIAELQRFAEAGWEEAAIALGQQLIEDGPTRDPEAAYKWLHIGFAWSDYLTAWNNTNSSDDVYTGPVGDFRNEAQVCELLDEIPHHRLKELDSEATEWLAEHERYA